jgi:hypothetical protein
LNKPVADVSYLLLFAISTKHDINVETIQKGCGSKRFLSTCSAEKTSKIRISFANTAATPERNGTEYVLIPY